MMPDAGAPIRVMVVDDEPLARERVIHFLKDQAEFELVGAAGDGDTALKLLFECEPEILLLDIQMPGRDGFELLTQIPEAQRPVCIFITAYPQHAVEAFEVAALDYVLKPFRAKRLGEALARAKAALPVRAPQAEAKQVNAAEAEHATVTIELYGSTLNLAVEDINWIMADGNYVKIHARKHTYFKRVPLTQMLEQLEPFGFLRIHRSILVNKASIARYTYLGNNAYQLDMADGAQFRTGRAYKQAIADILG